MADSDASKAAEPPKPVHIGGESFVDRVLPHIKKIMFVCVGIAAVAAFVFGARACKQSGERKDTSALAEIVEVANRDLRGSAAEDPKHPSFTDTKSRAAGVLDVITKKGNNMAGPAFKAGLLLDTGKFDEAITEYRTCETKEDLEGVLCREGLGIAIESKAAAEKDATVKQKGLQEALDAFKAMQPDDEGLRAAYAHYHQGRILQIMQKNVEAKAAFEKAKELGKDTSDLPDLIEKRLASLGA